MGYLIDLEDMDEQKMVEELVRRSEARRVGKCDYCSRPRDTTPSCKHPDRHARTESGPEITVSCGKCGEKRTIRDADSGIVCKKCGQMTMRIPPGKYFEKHFLEVYEFKLQSVGPRDVKPKSELRKLLLKACGEASAFKMIRADAADAVDLEAELQAAKATGVQLEETLKQAVALCNSESQRKGNAMSVDEVTPEALEKMLLAKITDTTEAERAKKILEGYGRRLFFDVTNVLLHAVDKGKVDEVLGILERHYNEDLAYQHPEIRGTVGGKTSSVLIGICRDTLGLASAPEEARVPQEPKRASRAASLLVYVPTFCPHGQEIYKGRVREGSHHGRCECCRRPSDAVNEPPGGLCSECGARQ